MTLHSVEKAPPDTDDGVDGEIAEYLNPKNLKSFFLYAGAGSGKTKSLVTSLETFRAQHGGEIRRSGKKIGVITYTNAACDEISSRLDADPIFHISTIHSYCWSQIVSLHSDIQIWLKQSLPKEIAELEEQQAKGQSGSQAAIDRARSIASKKERLEWLSKPRRFSYNPNGDNFGADSLSHSEVLKITADFIETKPSMQALLVSRFPIMLIDESQDTNKQLIDAFFALEAAHREKFVLGLFGDTMQRIYGDGKPNLDKSIPSDWAKPKKQMNHRSPQRIVALGNALRSSVDNQRQFARDDSEQGIVRLFIAGTGHTDKPSLELGARKRMVEIASDTEWTADATAVKTLTLEHHMAAARMGFLDLFRALDQAPRLREGLRNGDLAGVRLFSNSVAPLMDANKRDDHFAVMALLRKQSPLLKPSSLKDSPNLSDPLSPVRDAVKALMKLDAESEETTFLNVLECIASNGLFEIPESLKPFAGEVVSPEDEKNEDEEADDEEDEKEESRTLRAWREFLEVPYKQVVPYAEYIADRGEFGTHQGVKGQEFDRVLVIMDDSEARGFSFSYEKLFGVKPLTANDKKRKDEGEEIGVDRTRRLLYVTCTRAKKSLALVAYTDAPDKLAAHVVQQGWFEETEVERI